MKRRRPIVLVIIGLLVSASSTLHAGSLTSEVNGFRVQLTSNPEDATTKGETEYVVRMVDKVERPVTDARLTLRGAMGDGMSVVAPLRSSGEPGLYRGRVLFTMGGTWKLTLRITRGNQQFDVPMTEHVER